MSDELQACLRGFGKAAEMLLSALMFQSVFLTLALMASVVLV